MKKNPKVSIIIPVYNGADYVEEAIKSALSQTYKNIEIIVVNDGSKDDGKTKKVVSKYLNQVQYYEKENGGVSTALNLAISKMTGDFFSWLSHDDRYYENKIEEQIKLLENYPKNTILYSDYDLMDENSNIFASNKLPHQELIEKKEYALLRGAINGITLLIPKKAFDECGIFREDLRCTQDYELWLRMMEKYEFIHQDKILATTRLHKMQTGNTSPKMLTEGKDLWIDIIEHFNDTKKEQLDGSVFMYYSNALEFIKTTPYTDVAEYLEIKLRKLENEVVRKVEKTKVSVLITSTENEEELKSTINSIEKQTHKNYEIIINKNKKIKLPKDNKKIKLVETLQENEINVGIEQSTGDYIAIIEAGNEFLPEKLEKQLIDMFKKNSDICYTSYNSIKGEKINCQIEEKNTLKECITTNKINLSTIIIRKEIVTKNNVKYNIKNQNTANIIWYLDMIKTANITYYDDYLTNIVINYKTLNPHDTEYLKNILKYLLQDQHYEKDNELISEIAYKLYASINNIKDSNEINKCENIDYKSNLKYESRLKRYCNILKNKGIVYCIKKIPQKLIAKIKR